MPTFWTVNKKLLAQNKKKEKNGGQILNEGKLQIVRLFMKYQFIFLHFDYETLHAKLCICRDNVLGVPYSSANTYCKSRNNPNTNILQLQYRIAVISEAPSNGEYCK